MSPAPVVDPWTISHLALGFGAAWLGLRLLPALGVAVAWELVELAPLVRSLGWGDPSGWNSVVDVAALVVGWVWHVCHGIATGRPLRLEEP